MSATRTRFAAAGLILAGVLFAVVSFAPVEGYAWHRKGKDKRIHGSGDLVKKTLDLKDFDRVRVNAVAEIDIEIGPRFDVVVEAEDNIIDLLDVDVSGGRLTIDMDDRYDIDTDEDVRFEITMPSLVGLDIRGVADIVVSGLDEKSVEIDCQGVCKVYCQGTAMDLDIDFPGVGSLDLEDLRAANARVRVDGVGNVDVRVTDKLDVEVNGMGKVRYYGDPYEVRTDVSGFGRISRAK
jgi:hypothetical protein